MRSARSSSARTAAGEEVSFAELSDEVTRLAEGLVALGVEPGDRVGLYLPMCPEVAVASHACAHRRGAGADLLGLRSAAVAQRVADSKQRS